jgi:hydrogenase maturation protein HypF
MDDLNGIRIHIKGIVQGVGFRPFVFGLATRLELTGWVRNTSAGVDIELDGPSQMLDRFIQNLETEFPPLARIDEITIEPRRANGFNKFEIIHSESIPEAFQPISPDVAICPDCLHELFDPQDRRYLYPFINCTNCGPRFTIIKDIPYDRPKTTMGSFEMCPECLAEYEDPLDRRFHAQPVACPNCGPQIWMEFPGEKVQVSDFEGTEKTIAAVQEMLCGGQIVAVKGLGGYHLACDATNPDAVNRLREKKLRVDKPFAVMMPDIETVESHCYVTPVERQALTSRERPIVILKCRPGSDVSNQVSPRQDTLGVMLPYTPLHYLLFAPSRNEASNRRSQTPPSVLVMTSGNLSEEPIASDNEEARQRLGCLADAFLMHDRPIQTRCDDSVLRVLELPQGPPMVIPLRRSRGYAPFPVRLPWETGSILAAGAELKNTFCITRERYAFLSHHIGDLENFETLQSFEEGIEHFERLFRVKPEALAYDLHPDYLATRYVLERSAREGLPAIGVQHHHAHISACMAEHGLQDDRPVIGVSFDGTGYGVDGAIWGGEFLLADYSGFMRLAHLRYVPLPGGDKAIREPWRQALAWLDASGLAWEEDLPPVIEAVRVGNSSKKSGYSSNELLRVIRHQLHAGINAPLTSSMGRLFDAVAALVGVRQLVNYEAQAAIELEALADPYETNAYQFGIRPTESTAPFEAATYPWLVDPAPVFVEILSDLRAGVSIGKISARFHNSAAQMVLEILLAMRKTSGVSDIALSGGVWQNMLLLQKTVQLLSKDGFTVLVHNQVPTNDGGLALGQAIITASHMKSGTLPASSNLQAGYPSSI